MTDYTFHIETLVSAQPDIARLGSEGFAEVDQRQELMRFDPDWDQYLKAEVNGMLRLYTVQVNGERVGYALFFIQPNLHCRGQYTAVSDSLYIQQKHRGCGITLLQLAKEDLKNEGVSYLSITVKVQHDNGKMGQQLDMTHYENIYQCGLK